MTADIQNFPDAVFPVNYGAAWGYANAAQQASNSLAAIPGKPARKPLTWMQMKWVEETYGPRRDHPPCLTVQNTPSINSLNGLGEPSIGPVGLSHE